MVVDRIADLGVAHGPKREPFREVAQGRVVVLPLELREAEQRPRRPGVGLELDEAGEGPNGLRALATLVGEGPQVPPALVPGRPEPQRVPVPADRLLGMALAGRGRPLRGLLEGDRGCTTRRCGRAWRTLPGRVPSREGRRGTRRPSTSKPERGSCARPFHSIPPAPIAGYVPENEGRAPPEATPARSDRPMCFLEGEKRSASCTMRRPNLLSSLIFPKFALVWAPFV